MARRTAARVKNRCWKGTDAPFTHLKAFLARLLFRHDAGDMAPVSRRRMPPSGTTQCLYKFSAIKAAFCSKPKWFESELVMVYPLAIMHRARTADPLNDRAQPIDLQQRKKHDRTDYSRLWKSQPCWASSIVGDLRHLNIEQEKESSMTVKYWMILNVQGLPSKQCIHTYRFIYLHKLNLHTYIYMQINANRHTYIHNINYLHIVLLTSTYLRPYFHLLLLTYFFVRCSPFYQPHVFVLGQHCHISKNN